jgi:hypothetical protein
MDIIVRSVLEFIQQEKKNTILAGGAVRDTILGVQPKDYDIFVPSNTPKDKKAIVAKLNKEFNIDGFKDKQIDYEKTTVNTLYHQDPDIKRLDYVWNFTLEGKQIEVIGVREPDDEDFPTSIIQSFDYGLNMVYDNGSYVDDQNINFTNDFHYEWLSLINLRSISHLPNAIARFERLHMKFLETGRRFKFKAPCLTLFGGEEKAEPSSKKKYSGAGVNTAWINAVQGTFTTGNAAVTMDQLVDAIGPEVQATVTMPQPTQAWVGFPAAAAAQPFNPPEVNQALNDDF